MPERAVSFTTHIEETDIEQVAVLASSVIQLGGIFKFISGGVWRDVPQWGIKASESMTVWGYFPRSHLLTVTRYKEEPNVYHISPGINIDAPTMERVKSEFDKAFEFITSISQVDLHFFE